MLAADWIVCRKECKLIENTFRLCSVSFTLFFGVFFFFNLLYLPITRFLVIF